MAAKLLNILLVEDSPNDAGLIVRNIERAGYDVHWERVDDPVALKAALDKQAWDIILSDYCMPAFTGTYALAIIKAAGSGVPVIFVSGTMGEDVAVEAMPSGAQDYVFKGNLKRLVPAIEREVRDAPARRENQQAAQALRQNEIRIAQLDRLKAILGRVNSAIIHIPDQQNLLNEICRIAVEEGLFKLAWFGERIAIVLTIWPCRSWTVPAAINAIRTLNPAAKIIASSGLPPAAGNAADLGVNHFVPSPTPPPPCSTPWPKPSARRGKGKVLTTMPTTGGLAGAPVVR